MMEALFPPTVLSKVSPEQSRFIRHCIDVVVMVFELYGFDTTGFKRKGTYLHWEYCASQLGGDGLKLAKYKFAAFYAQHKCTFDENIELPPSILKHDNAGVLLGGRAYKYMMMMKNKKSLKFHFESFLTSMLYAKKGMPRPDKTYLRRAEVATFQKLTSPEVVIPPKLLLSWADTDDIHANIECVLSRESVSHQISRTVTELLGKSIFTISDRVEPFFPSTSANYINSRNDGGVIGSILANPELMDGLRTVDELITTRSVDHFGEKWNVFDDSKLRSSFTELYSRMCKKTVTEEAIAVPLALPEALKVRVISKGPPLHYTVLKPLQKKLWSVLKSHPVFTLIGKPVTADYVQERMGSKLGVGQKFLSVDYSDATNEMYSWCSDVAVECICDHWMIQCEERAAFFRAMTGHTIELANEHGRGVKRELQTRGQLMGSVVSFPILCIINAAICRWAKELSDNRIYTLKDCPLAINGDDAILRINELGRTLWARIGTFCGLSPSVGKVYYSKNFLNINSTTFNFYPYDRTDPDNFPGYEGLIIVTPEPPLLEKFWKKTYRVRCFQLVKYVNLGLLLGMKRSGGAFTLEDSDGHLTLGARCHQLIADAPEMVHSIVMKKFIMNNMKSLCKYNLPWFVPEKFGGMGLPVVDRSSSELERRVANKIYRNSKKFSMPSKPVDAPWKVWKYVTERFPDSKFNISTNQLYTLSNKYGPEIKSEFSNLDTLRGLACVEQLFRATSISDLYDDKSKTDISNYYRTIRRTWLRALHDQSIKMPEPLNFSRIPADYKTSTISILRRTNLLISL